MDIITNQPPLVIAPLVARHAEDAAFYWSQLDHADCSMQIGLTKYTHFNQLLNAHLEGLQVAGSEGQRLVQVALQRWKGASEAFICTWLLAQTDDTEAIAEHFVNLSKQPGTMLRGAISALAWTPRNAALSWLARLAVEDAPPVNQVAALRAAALLGPQGINALPSPLTSYLASPNAFVRAAACREASPDNESSNLQPALRIALQDTDLAVRAEAAIALARHPESHDAAAVLWQCVAAQADAYPRQTGWHRKQATRRLLRWVRHLAAITPVGHEDIPQLLHWLPARIGLTFILHHGDMTYLPHVLDCMNNPNETRYAGWVWQTLTGLDLAGNGWVLPEPDPDDTIEAITEARLDADQGLPIPDVAAIQAAQTVHQHTLPHRVRSLLGQELTPSHAVTLLETAPQALRGIAAQALMQAFPGRRISVRGPASAQLRQLADLRSQVLA
jgi:uncharacterized protein (TIGR02270 family)